MHVLGYFGGIDEGKRRPTTKWVEIAQTRRRKYDNLKAKELMSSADMEDHVSRDVERAERVRRGEWRPTSARQTVTGAGGTEGGESRHALSSDTASAVFQYMLNAELKRPLEERVKPLLHVR